MTIKLNLHIIVYVLGGVFSVLYLLYTILPSRSFLSEYHTYASANSWKKAHSILNMPDDFWIIDISIISKKKHITFTLEQENNKVCPACLLHYSIIQGSRWYAHFHQVVCAHRSGRNLISQGQGKVGEF